VLPLPSKLWTLRQEGLPEGPERPSFFRKATSSSLFEVLLQRAGGGELYRLAGRYHSDRGTGRGIPVRSVPSSALGRRPRVREGATRSPS